MADMELPRLDNAAGERFVEEFVESHSLGLPEVPEGSRVAQRRIRRAERRVELGQQIAGLLAEHSSPLDH